jgi:hypothetical protein
MKMRWFLVLVLAIGAHEAHAASGSGRLEVVVNATATITATITSAPCTTSTGPVLTRTNFGTVSRYGTAPCGLTLTRSQFWWLLDGTIGIRVTKANLTSSGYTLAAATMSSSVTHLLDSITLTPGAKIIYSNGAYDVTRSVPWTLKIANTTASATYTTLINISIASN